MDGVFSLGKVARGIGLCWISREAKICSSLNNYTEWSFNDDTDPETGKQGLASAGDMYASRSTLQIDECDETGLTFTFTPSGTMVRFGL